MFFFLLTTLSGLRPEHDQAYKAGVFFWSNILDFGLKIVIIMGRYARFCPVRPVLRQKVLPNRTMGTPSASNSLSALDARGWTKINCADMPTCRLRVVTPGQLCLRGICMATSPNQTKRAPDLSCAQPLYHMLCATPHLTHLI